MSKTNFQYYYDNCKNVLKEANYDLDFGYVKVKNLNNINCFLQNKEEHFSKKGVQTHW